MKYLFALILFQFSILFAHTQDKPNTPNMPKKQAVYMEAGGNGFASISLNYERSLDKENASGFRVGFGYYQNSDDHQYYSFPFEFIYKIGSHKHKFETGLGLTYYLETVEGYSGGAFILVGRLGYSYNAEKGLLVRVGFTPLVEMGSMFLNNAITPFGGISIGYAF